MKCFIKSLLGMNQASENNNDDCIALHPIVKSLVGSTVFIVLMVSLSHFLRT